MAVLAAHTQGKGELAHPLHESLARDVLREILEVLELVLRFRSARVSAGAFGRPPAPRQDDLEHQAAAQGGGERDPHG